MGCSRGRRDEDTEDQSEGHHSADHQDNRRSESCLRSILPEAQGSDIDRQQILRFLGEILSCSCCVPH